MIKSLLGSYSTINTVLGYLKRIDCSDQLLTCSSGLESVNSSRKIQIFGAYLSFTFGSGSTLVLVFYYNKFAYASEIEKLQMKSSAAFRPGAMPCLHTFNCSAS